MKKTVIKKNFIDTSTRKYYKGPMFAAPGEIGPLFGYCSFDNSNQID